MDAPASCHSRWSGFKGSPTSVGTSELQLGNQEKNRVDDEMIDFDKELASILEHDPLGLLEIKPKASSVISADERLIASFAEITAFRQQHGHKPTASRDIGERRLYSRLQGLRESPEKVTALTGFDEFGLLAEISVQEQEEVYTVDDVLGDDPLGLLDDASEETDPADIFQLVNVPKSVAAPDFIAKRKPCKEFAQFEPIFKQVHADLLTKKKTTRPFTNERHIVAGSFFLVQGMLVYIANKGKEEKRNFGNVNARLYCIFENGTESNMLLRSLASSFWKDKNSRHIVNADQLEMFDKAEQIGADDEATGYIYVLKSLSKDPRIAKIENLYKIGFSSQPVEQRIQNAAQEPTYLMADVRLVTEFKTYNLNPQKMELLLHTFFAKACLNIDVNDEAGKRHTPREWFIAPLHLIEVAVQLLLNGEIVDYRYDTESQEIMER